LAHELTNSMESEPRDSASLVRLEKSFFAAFLLLSVGHLVTRWGRLQGYDRQGYLEMFQAVRWGEALPGVRALWESYNPPLAFLLARPLLWLVPNAVAATQLFSTLSVVAGIVALRWTLQYTGLLPGPAGIVFLYSTAALPLSVFLSIETGIDGVMFFWCMAALACSTAFSWKPLPDSRGAWRGRIARALLLSACLAAAITTKLNGLILLALPFLVVAVRVRPWRRLLRQSAWSAACVSLALLLATPVYVGHFYRSEGTLLPIPTEWYGRRRLQGARAQRNTDRLAFLRHILRLPETGLHEQTIPLTDSVLHSLWFQTWKREKHTAWASKRGQRLGEIESNAFLAAFLIGTALFFFVRGRPPEWNHFGWVLLVAALLFAGALVRFGYLYPVFAWKPFKAKYVPFTILWIPFAVSVCVLELSRLRMPLLLRRVGARLGALALLLMLFLNYMVPTH
jgi:hypothetical protein